MGDVAYEGVALENGVAEGGAGGDWYTLPGVTVDGPVADEPMLEPLPAPGVPWVADESPAEDVSA